MAAMAGLSQPLELSTSTQAWISRIALLRISSVSCDIRGQTNPENKSFTCWSSAESCILDMCACSSRFAFTCGSLNFDDCSLFGSLRRGVNK